MNFSLLLKPVSSACNLTCRYCYYRGEEPPAAGGGSVSPRMSAAVLEATVRAYMQTAQDVYTMVWHGGEPTLLPRSFFAQAVTLQKRCAARGARIANSIQTNGTRISDDLAAFMAHYRFLCGVSLDGPRQMHERFRRAGAGGGTHAAVLAGLARLSRAGVAVNILAVVSAANVGRPVETYRYLKSLGATHIQFVPCVEYDARHKLRAHAITGRQWGRFLVAVFEDWFRHDIGAVSVRLFESVMARLVHDIAIDCYNSAACNRYLVVEHNGDVFPCDFFVRPSHKLGNVLENAFEEMRGSEAYRNFAAGKQRWGAVCAACEFLPLCMGDCPKYRIPAENGAGRTSALCAGWKAFYGQTLGRFQRLADRLKPGVHADPR